MSETNKKEWFDDDDRDYKARKEQAYCVNETYKKIYYGATEHAFSRKTLVV